MIRLPDSLPILPVRDNLLLPGGQITQKLFEPRYINMVQDALASQDRMIGVCITDSSSKWNSKDKFFDIGCAGKITSFEEMVDGTFLVVLTGYCRFRLIKEIPTMRQYRRFETYFDDYDGDLVIKPNPNIDKEKLISLIRGFAELNSINMDWAVLPGTPAFNLITFFSMHLPLEDSQRQLLLEAQTVESRGVALTRLLQEILEKEQREGDKS